MHSDTRDPEHEPRSPRARYRDQLKREIKDVARRQLAELGGAGQLSLNAVARELGMRGPSLYRYFESRDALITALLVDAYADLHHTLEGVVADARNRGEPPAEHLRSCARAYRGWGLANPELFDLLYGRPVPGYHAPPQTGPMARGSMQLFTGLVRAVRMRQEPSPPAPVAEPVAPDADQDFLLAVQLAAGCHGLLVLELHGHLAQMAPDPAALYEAQLDAILDRILTAGPG
ncbi:TetR/AcrR family transcriptional regulator [Rhizohabitans arisaemae]|uniref:TetR/AcrR family transcriptional regulator n=1 Tax=Rhizohabitans arisaemae TaxID=2720610 RepID=UPI0024B0DD8D|nr:TetR/AcrR family transcriptional regulator [Rhizohabitans arisaemae]